MITQIIRDEIANKLTQPNKIIQIKSTSDLNYDTYTYITQKLGLEINNIHTLQVWTKPNPSGTLYNILTICVLPQHITITTTKQNTSYTIHQQNSIQDAIHTANTIIQNHLNQ